MRIFNQRSLSIDVLCSLLVSVYRTIVPKSKLIVVTYLSLIPTPLKFLNYILCPPLTLCRCYILILLDANSFSE